MKLQWLDVANILLSLVFVALATYHFTTGEDVSPLTFLFSTLWFVGLTTYLLTQHYNQDKTS